MMGEEPLHEKTFMCEFVSFCIIIINFITLICSVQRQTVRPGTPPDFVLRVSVRSEHNAHD